MANNKPDFDVFVSHRTRDDKNFYTRVGAAWNVAKDGISIQLQALPITDREGKCGLVLFPHRDE